MGHPHGMFGWAEVAVPDMDQGEAFYSGLFGWKATEEAVERARGLGATVQREPWDTPFGRKAVLSNPQGPTFGIVTMTGQE